jgi:AmiR/NasT family two-component response regulator
VQAAKEIREQVDVPIVYLTAHSDRGTVDRASKTDHDGFILKPFVRRELQTTIEVAMQRYAMRAKQ